MLGYVYKDMTTEEKLQQFKNYYIALSMEQAELLQELPWKPWRDSEGQYHGKKADIIREWIDCLFFLFDQAFCLDITPEDIEDGFRKVLANNLIRIDKGYSSVKGKL